MAHRRDPVVMEDVEAVWFDRAVSICRLPPGIAGRGFGGKDGASGSNGGSTVRVMFLEGRYETRVVRAVVLSQRLSTDEITFPVLFTDDSGLLSRLREQFAVPAVWAQIASTIERRRVSVRADLFAQNTGEEVGQMGDSACARRVIGFKWSAPAGVASVDFPTELTFRQLFQVRDAERPDLARLEAVSDGKLHFEPMQDGSDRSSSPEVKRVEIRALTVSGGRNLDLVTDLGLPTYDDGFDGGFASQLRVTLAHSGAAVPVKRHRAFYEPRMDPRTPPPYVFEDVVSTGFKFAGKREHLDAIVDALLNAPEADRDGIARQNFRYVAASTEVVLEYLEYGSMRSTAPETSARRDEDFTSQFELCLRLIVGAIEEDGEAASDPMVFCPLLFVDNWASVVSGREVMGYWKRMAKFEPPRGNPHAESLRKRLWPHARFDVTEEGQWGGDDRTTNLTEEVTRRICPLGAKDVPIVQIRHALDRAALREDYRKPGRVGIGDARRLLPWRQTDFGDPRFRRQFARDWLRVSGESFDTIQRPFLAAPGPNGRPPKGGWIRTRNTVRDFRVVQPEGEAELHLGKFEDGELAARLLESGVLRDAGAVALGSPAIDLAKLLGVEAGPIKIPPADWYLASGSFDVKVIDRLA